MHLSCFYQSIAKITFVCDCFLGSGRTRSLHWLAGIQKIKTKMSKLATTANGVGKGEGGGLVATMATEDAIEGERTIASSLRNYLQRTSSAQTLRTLLFGRHGCGLGVGLCSNWLAIRLNG